MSQQQDLAPPTISTSAVSRALLMFVAVTALAACSTTAPERLRVDEFGEWIVRANAYVMEGETNDQSTVAKADTTDTHFRPRSGAQDTELQLVSERIARLVGFAQSTDGEASWVIRNWSDNSRKIGTLFDYFLTRGYLLNYRYETLGGNFFLPMGRDRYGLTYASTGLSRVFGEPDNFVSPWIVNDDGFTFAANYGPAPFLNRKRAEELKTRILSGAEEDESVSLGVDLGVVMQMLAAREVASSTLSVRYGFHNEADFNVAPLREAIPGLSVETAPEIHDFFAQATSLAAHPFGIYLLVADTLNVMSDAESESDKNSEYARTATGNFFVSSVNEILARLGRPYDVDSAFRVSTLREENDRWKAVGQIGNDILIHLGQRGLDDLRADYVQYAKTILNHIESES